MPIGSSGLTRRVCLPLIDNRGGPARSRAFVPTPERRRPGGRLPTGRDPSARDMRSGSSGRTSRMRHPIASVAASAQHEATSALPGLGGQAVAEDVELVGSRVSVMHLAYDCLRCTNTVAVSITDGKL